MTDELRLREAIIQQCCQLQPLGLNQGSAGNISARAGADMLITPSAIPYEDMTPEMIARMPLNGVDGEWFGPCAPSSEWRFHRDIFRARPEVNAIVHTHSLHATTLSILRKNIPAIHYMIALFGGADIRCTDYAMFGTQALSDLAVEGLKNRNGVLLGNHGMIVVGATLTQAMDRAVELETLARMYVLSLQIGEPVILKTQEMAEALERFKTYGKAQYLKL